MNEQETAHGWDPQPVIDQMNEDAQTQTTEDFIIYRDGQPIKVYYHPGSGVATAQPVTDLLDLVMTASEAVEEYGISIETFSKACQRGALPASKGRGKYWKVARADAEVMWGGHQARREMKERARGGG